MGNCGPLCRFHCFLLNLGVSVVLLTESGDSIPTDVGSMS